MQKMGWDWIGLDWMGLDGMGMFHYGKMKIPKITKQHFPQAAYCKSNVSVT